MPGRPWTAKELREAAAQRRAGLSFAAIASRLRRDPDAVRQQLWRHGHGGPRLSKARTEDAVRQLHARGMTDPEIARLIGRTKGHVWHVRRYLGLPANATRGAGRARELQRMLERLDVHSLADMRWLLQEQEARRRGYPGLRSLSDVKLVERIKPHLPITAAQLRTLLGICHLNAISKLMRLMRAGVLTRRIGKRTGARGHPGYVYELAPAYRDPD